MAKLCKRTATVDTVAVILKEEYIVDDLFLLIFFVSIVAVAVFIFKGFKNGWKFYKKKVFVSLGVMVASFILFGLTVDNEEVDQKQEQMELAEQQEAEKKEQAEKEQVEKEQKEKEQKEKEQKEKKEKEKKQKEKERKEKEEKEKAEKEAEEKEAEDLAEDTEEEIDWEEARAIDQENIDWRTDVTWDNLARNYEDYASEYVQIEGEAQTVQSDSDMVYIQLMMNGDVDQPVIVEAEQEYLESRILEGDWLTVQGYVLTLTDYQTVLGKTVTAPYFYGDFVTIH